MQTRRGLFRNVRKINSRCGRVWRDGAAGVLNGMPFTCATVLPCKRIAARAILLQRRTRAPCGGPHKVKQEVSDRMRSACGTVFACKRICATQARGNAAMRPPDAPKSAIYFAYVPYLPCGKFGCAVHRERDIRFLHSFHRVLSDCESQCVSACTYKKVTKNLLAR